MEGTCDKVDKINTKLAWVAGGASAIVAVALIIWALVNAVPWDRISIAPATPEAQQSAPPPAIKR